jgi:hypothetical protein
MLQQDPGLFTITYAIRHPRQGCQQLRTLGITAKRTYVCRGALHQSLGLFTITYAIRHPR